MVNKINQNNSDDSNFFQMVKNNISPLDLLIVSKLNNGESINDLAKIIEKEFKIKNPKKLIDLRFKKLLSEEKPEKKIIQHPHPKYVLNPAKLYDGIFIILIKANLVSSKTKNVEIGVNEVYKTIIDVNSKPHFNKPINQLYTMVGWIYDFVGIVFENNISRFYSFKEYLLTEGIAKSVDIIQVDTESEFLFEPVKNPDYFKFKQFLIHYRDRMSDMIEELSKNDVIAAKTINYFDKNNYCLRVESGKDKGEIYPIDGPELKIGRYYDNDVIIQDPAVSRRHAKIIKVGSTIIFKDESTNGSIINEKHINYDEKELHDGDVIKIGKLKYLFKKLS